MFSAENGQCNGFGSEMHGLCVVRDTPHLMPNYASVVSVPWPNKKRLRLDDSVLTSASAQEPMYDPANSDLHCKRLHGVAVTTPGLPSYDTAAGRSSLYAVRVTPNAHPLPWRDDAVYLTSNSLQQTFSFPEQQLESLAGALPPSVGTAPTALRSASGPLRSWLSLPITSSATDSHLSLSPQLSPLPNGKIGGPVYRNHSWPASPPPQPVHPYQLQRSLSHPGECRDHHHPAPLLPDYSLPPPPTRTLVTTALAAPGQSTSDYTALGVCPLVPSVSLGGTLPGAAGDTGLPYVNQTSQGSSSYSPAPLHRDPSLTSTSGYPYSQRLALLPSTRTSPTFRHISVEDEGPMTGAKQNTEKPSDWGSRGPDTPTRFGLNTPQVATHERVITCKTYKKRLNVTQYMADNLLPPQPSLECRRSTGVDDGYEQLFKVNVTLVDPQGTPWPVQYEGVMCCGQRHLRLTCGWADFIRSNEVELGDSISFERRGNDRHKLHVSIIRADPSRPGENAARSARSGKDSGKRTGRKAGTKRRPTPLVPSGNPEQGKSEVRASGNVSVAQKDGKPMSIQEDSGIGKRLADQISAAYSHARDEGNSEMYLKEATTPTVTSRELPDGSGVSQAVVSQQEQQEAGCLDEGKEVPAAQRETEASVEPVDGGGTHPALGSPGPHVLQTLQQALAVVAHKQRPVAVAFTEEMLEELHRVLDLVRGASPAEREHALAPQGASTILTGAALLELLQKQVPLVAPETGPESEAPVFVMPIDVITGLPSIVSTILKRQAGTDITCSASYGGPLHQEKGVKEVVQGHRVGGDPGASNLAVPLAAPSSSPPRALVLNEAEDPHLHGGSGGSGEESGDSRSGKDSNTDPVLDSLNPDQRTIYKALQPVLQPWLEMVKKPEGPVDRQDP